MQRIDHGHRQSRRHGPRPWPSTGVASPREAGGAAAQGKRRCARPARADATDVGRPATGLALAVVMVFLLLAANFQSRPCGYRDLDDPGGDCGRGRCALANATTLNIQSFMGAIMAVGVAVANAILLVTFAERSRLAGTDADDAAVLGAQSRLRPILMTSLAMMPACCRSRSGWGGGATNCAARPGGRRWTCGRDPCYLSGAALCLRDGAGSRNRRSVSLDPDDPHSAHFISAAAPD